MEAFVSEHAREYHFDFTPEEGMREFEANGYSFFWLNVMDRYVCGASHVQSFFPLPDRSFAAFPLSRIHLCLWS